MRLSAAEWQVAQHACTPRQLQALDYWQRGCTYRRISALLDIELSSTYDLVARARRALAKAIRDTESAATSCALCDWTHEGHARDGRAAFAAHLAAVHADVGKAA